MNLPRRALAELAAGGSFFARIEETHSQPANIERVAKGEADATCVDCVTFAFFARHRPDVASAVRILAVTPGTPAIPFVTAVSTPDAVRETLVAALMAVARQPEWATARAGLALRDVSPATVADYGVPCRYADEAAALGYALLS
jgi:ABC-type phosphate/phosphonate transport system substrate-binding protein